MPTMIKPKSVTEDRASGARTTQRYPMYAVPLLDLVEMFNRSSTAPKIKQKIRNELVRRKAEIPA